MNLKEFINKIDCSYNRPMNVGVHSMELSLSIEFKVSAITSCRDGTVFIDGRNAEGRIFTVTIAGLDDRGRTFRQAIESDEDPPEGRAE